MTFSTEDTSSTFKSNLTKIETYQSDVATLETNLSSYLTNAQTYTDSINLGDWSDKVETKFSNFITNSLQKGITAMNDDLTGGSFNTLKTTVDSLHTSVDTCYKKKDQIEKKILQLDRTPEYNTVTIPNPTPSYMTDLSSTADDYITAKEKNPAYTQLEEDIKTLKGELETAVGEANGYISTLEGLTFDASDSSGGSGDKSGDKGGDKSGDKGGDKSGDKGGDKSGDKDGGKTFRDGGLGGMTEADAYPDGNLNHGSTIDIQYTDVNGEVHDAKLKFNGNVRNPSDPGGWTITQENPDGTTTTVPTYAIGMNDDGSYQINVYNNDSSGSSKGGTAQPAVSSDSKKQDFKERQIDERTPAPSTSAEGSSNLTSTNPRSKYYKPDSSNLTSTNPRSKYYKDPNQQTSNNDTSNTTNTDKPSATTTSSPANSGSRRDQVASEMNLRDQVSLMDNVHSTGSVRFNHNSDDVYLQPDANKGDYGLFRADGSRIDGYSFTHDQVTQSQYDENNWATYPEVEDALLDYFTGLEE